MRFHTRATHTDGKLPGSSMRREGSLRMLLLEPARSDGDKLKRQIQPNTRLITIEFTGWC